MGSSFGFVGLLNSQGSLDFSSSEPVWSTPIAYDEPAVKERRKWSIKEDKVLIGAWLNTSKDPVVGNEQKAAAFWKRIQDYFNSSPLLVGKQPREQSQCKQRWQRINDQVCKLCGSFEAAMKEQRSGQNDDDVMKSALEIFNNDYSVKFAMEHAWRELRFDQEWSSIYQGKDGLKDKQKQAPELSGEDSVGQTESRPIGVKAAKAEGKRKKSAREQKLFSLKGILEAKNALNKQKILECLLNKKERLTDIETTLKLRLISEML